MSEKSIDERHLEHLQGMQYGFETMRWYGWGSPIGLGLFILSLAGSVWVLHLANIIK